MIINSFCTVHFWVFCIFWALMLFSPQKQRFVSLALVRVWDIAERNIHAKSYESQFAQVENLHFSLHRKWRLVFPPHINCSFKHKPKRFVYTIPNIEKCLALSMLNLGELSAFQLFAIFLLRTCECAVDRRQSFANRPSPVNSDCCI